jgi:hypothetical protein
MAEDAVERMDGFARGAGDHGLVEGRIAVGDGGVDLHHRIATVMRIDRPAGFTRSAQIERLPVRRRPMTMSEPGGDRLGVDGVGQAGQRGPEGFLAHMPCLHAQERAA